jgi:YVTN family beta-propeller protein
VARAAEIVAGILGTRPRLTADPENDSVRGALSSRPVRTAPALADDQDAAAAQAGPSGLASAGLAWHRPDRSLAWQPTWRWVAAAAVAAAIVGGTAGFIARVLAPDPRPTATAGPRGATATASPEAEAARFPANAFILKVPTSLLQGAQDTVTPVDTLNGTAGRPLKVGFHASSITLAPDGMTLYVLTSQGLIPINTETDTAGRLIKVGAFPQQVFIAPDSKLAYVLGGGSGPDTVTTVNLVTATAGPSIAVGADAQSIVFTPDSKTAYVLENTGAVPGTVTPVSTATDAVGPPITVGLSPDSMAITPDGRTIYVVNTDSGTVTPVITATDTAGPAIPVGGHAAVPLAITISANSSTAWVASGISNDPYSGTVTPVSTATDTPGAAITVPVGPSSDEIAISPDGKTVYVGGSDSSSSGVITAISAATDTASTPVPLGSTDSPDSLVFAPDGSVVYAVEEGSVIPVSTAANSPGPAMSPGLYGFAVLPRPPSGRAAPSRTATSRPASSPPSSLVASVPMLGTVGPGAKGCGTAQPSYIYGGGDASDQVQDITWTSWGSKMATGTGRALWVTTTVTAGQLEPARLVAFDLGQIDGHYAYRSLDIYFPQHGQRFNPSSSMIC